MFFSRTSNKETLIILDSNLCMHARMCPTIACMRNNAFISRNIYAFG